MHVITRCNSCARQYDTEGHDPGERFHCLCGKLLTVPEKRDYDAAVVRCSSCGGAREKQDTACGHCGADFTLIEQQLNTSCPACFARISDVAKYCHHCATPIMISGTLGESTNKACPKCCEKHGLSSRKIKDTDMSALECNLCGGIWLDREVFLEIEKRMIDLASTGIDKDHSKLLENIPRQSMDDQNLYRRCPTCEKFMQRRNYGPGSGIIIDQCHQHGYWFDQQELDVTLRWIRTGGLLASRKKKAAIKRDNDRIANVLKKMDGAAQQWKLGSKWKDHL